MCRQCDEESDFFHPGGIYAFVDDEAECPDFDCEVLLILESCPIHHKWFVMDMLGRIKMWGLSPNRRRRL